MPVREQIAIGDRIGVSRVQANVTEARRLFGDLSFDPGDDTAIDRDDPHTSPGALCRDDHGADHVFRILQRFARYE